MKFRLLGNPVAHSRSPQMQNAAFAALRIDAEYLAVHVESAEEMGIWADELRLGKIAGCNITAPYKELALQLADEATPLAKRLGGANIWLAAHGRVIAANSDYCGVIACLRGVRRETEAVIYGAGGAARAAVAAASDHCARVWIVNRSFGRAEALALALNGTGVGEIVPISLSDQLSLPWSNISLVINTTSVSWATGAPIEPSSALRSSRTCTVLDLNYGKPLDALRACFPGSYVLDGATMLLHQGARALTAWTGLPAPVTAMREALARSLGRPNTEIDIDQASLNSEI